METLQLPTIWALCKRKQTCAARADLCRATPARDRVRYPNPEVIVCWESGTRASCALIISTGTWKCDVHVVEPRLARILCRNRHQRNLLPGIRMTASKPCSPLNLINQQAPLAPGCLLGRTVVIIELASKFCECCSTSTVPRLLNLKPTEGCYLFTANPSSPPPRTTSTNS
jgi:hypothetical protein